MNDFCGARRESNPISIIVNHLAGNMRSRWTDFLTTNGEKPDRDRDYEFEAPPTTRAQVIDAWESGKKILFATLESLGEADLARTVTIRTEPHSVTQAINRQIAHYSYHIGQIVFLAKHFAGDRWKALTVPRNKSARFNGLTPRLLQARNSNDECCRASCWSRSPQMINIRLSARP